MSTTNAPPEPSPAPTLSPQFPGFFPPTPAAVSPSASPSHSDALDRAGASLLEPLSHVSTAGVLLGAAAGFALGGPVGAAIGGGLIGVGTLENEALAAREHDNVKGHENSGLPATVTNPGFAVQSDNANAALADSPAQKLVGGDSSEGSKLTGEGALGGALLAGAAGAKVEENEVDQPGIAIDEIDHSTGIALTEGTKPPAPDFGTPAVEKEQAALAASPAQQLLGNRTASTLNAEETLLAGGAGAKAENLEVAEPDTTLPKEVPGGAGALVVGSASRPLERESSTAPAPAPSAPHPIGLKQIGPRDSDSSFAAAVLAAGERVHTPAREDVPLSIDGSGREHPLIEASDADQDNVAYNPEPKVLAAATGAGIAAPLAAETSSEKPKDFEPYTPPTVEPSPAAEELKVAAAVPLPATPAEEPTNVSKQLSPAIVPASFALVSAGTEPQYPQHITNAQNLKQQREPIVADESVAHARSPEHDELDRGKLLKPRDREDPSKKGKGKEALGGAAVGAAAGAAGAEALNNHEKPGSTPTSVFRENFTTPQPRRESEANGFLDPPVLASHDTATGVDTTAAHDPLTGRGDPLDDQRAFPTVPHMKPGASTINADELVLQEGVADSRGAGGGRATHIIDAKELASVKATSPEQAGFNRPSSAAMDFAHLSDPAPGAEDAALRKVEEEEQGKSKVAFIAGAGMAGVGAGALAGGIPARDHVAFAPVAAAVEPAQPTTYAQPQPSKFAASRPLGVLGGTESPSSTRAVKGTPPPLVSSTDASPVASVRSPSPGTSMPSTPRATGGLADGIERSPHMKIQTHTDSAGHKRLHRKSLSLERKPILGIGATHASTRSSGESARERPALNTVWSEDKRDRMLDGLTGVPDPAVYSKSSSLTPVGRVTPPPSSDSRFTNSTSASPTAAANMPASGPGQMPASVDATSTGSAVVGSGGAGVQRKFSKARHSSGAAAGEEHQPKKEGFLHKVLHRSSGEHKRTASGGSIDGLEAPHKA
ncbi:hypothetical protein JCM1841_005711 [Sporobolomyces salmonicolor]